MKNHLVSGGCGFVGRNMVKRLYKITEDRIVFVDNLSVGTDPDTWLALPLKKEFKNLKIYGKDERLLFVKADFSTVLRGLSADSNWFLKTYGLEIRSFSDVFHFAAIVGGRTMIEGNPMKVALDLAIDAEFFYWITRHKPSRVLYPSSSAAYPIDKQTQSYVVQLRERDINFSNLGKPDMTYGWSKLTGEFLAKLAAHHYGVHITCIRPFSGYGEDQDYSYPIPAIARRAVLKENPFEVWGTGYQGRDFIHIDDILDCTLLAMEHISDGSAVNIGMGKLTTFREIITLFCKIAGYQAEIKCLLDKPVGVFSRYCSIEYAAKTLNWKPKISLEAGLRRVFKAVSRKELA